MSTHLYKMVCPSVCQSVCRSFRQSVTCLFCFFDSAEMRQMVKYDSRHLLYSRAPLPLLKLMILKIGVIKVNSFNHFKGQWDWCQTKMLHNALISLIIIMWKISFKSIRKWAKKPHLCLNASSAQLSLLWKNQGSRIRSRALSTSSPTFYCLGHGGNLEEK